MTKFAKSIGGLVGTLSLVGMTGSAGAVSMRVQMACSGDYYAHCSAYSPDSPQVRSCMRSVGAPLSKGCISALVAAGEVSAAEVAGHGATGRVAKARTASK